MSVKTCLTLVFLLLAMGSMSVQSAQAEGDLTREQASRALAIVEEMYPRVYENSKAALPKEDQEELDKLEELFFVVTGYNSPLVMQSSRFDLCHKNSPAFAAKYDLYRPALDKWLRAIEKQKAAALTDAVYMLASIKSLPHDILRPHFEIILNKRYEHDLKITPKMVELLFFPKGAADGSCQDFGQKLLAGLTQDLGVKAIRGKDGKLSVESEFNPK